MKISKILVVVLLIAGFMATMVTESAYAAQWHRRARRRGVAVVRPRVIVSPKPRVVTVSKFWPEAVILETELTPLEVEESNIGSEYGLIDFEIYPYSTKIYIDGDYKGYARTLNKDKYSKKLRKGKHIIELKKKNASIKVISVVVKEGYKTTIQQN